MQDDRSQPRLSITAKSGAMQKNRHAGFRAALRKSPAWAINEGQPSSLIAFGLQSLQLSVK
jgi:hypothetical protein